MGGYSKDKYLDILQIFRGIAALMVVCHHTINTIIYYHQIDSQFFYSLGIIGKYGVDFFFVLSGFIISYTSFFKYNNANAFSEFLKNRLIRIYVPYLPIGILMLILYQIFPTISNSNRNISTLTSLSLFPHGNPALSVAWSLTYELLFYLLFSISFYSKKGWNLFVGVWFSLLISFNFTSLHSLAFLKIPFFQVLFSTYNFEFLLGYLLSFIYIYNKRQNFVLVNVLLFSFLSGFITLVVLNINLFKFATNLFFSSFIFFLLYIVLQKNKFTYKKTNFFMIIGNATYSIYLIHNPLQMILIRLYPKISSVISLILALLLSLVVCTLFGYLYFLIFEKWASTKVKSIVTN